MTRSPGPVNVHSDANHPACIDPEILLKDCQIRHVRRSGPGGQHRNKVETGVVIKHLPTNITAEASEKRQQGRNRSMALFRLRINLAIDHRMEAVPEEPSALWQRRLWNGTLKVNSEHVDFPALLSEALDAIAHFQFDIKASSQYFQCSSSQLIKFLKKEPRAFTIFNRKRCESGLHPLK
ncbi:MAG: peptide chain release factor-like protein [Gimesia sp.]